LAQRTFTGRWTRASWPSSIAKRMWHSQIVRKPILKNERRG
jgi:hypothetical protein